MADPLSFSAVSAALRLETDGSLTRRIARGNVRAGATAAWAAARAAARADTGDAAWAAARKEFNDSVADAFEDWL